MVLDGCFLRSRARMLRCMVRPTSLRRSTRSGCTNPGDQGRAGVMTGA